MNAPMIVALAIAIPVLLFPAALIWYMNVSGIVQALRKAAREEKSLTATER